MMEISKSSKKVRVLQILVGGDTFTGISSYLYQFYSYMDREKVHFDFLFCTENSLKMKQDDPIFDDSLFYELHARKKNSSSTDYIAAYKGIKKHLKNHKYDFVVINTSVVAAIVACIMAAKNHPELCIISHAHNMNVLFKNHSLRGRLKKLTGIFDNGCRSIIRRNCRYFFACSEEAAIATFGKKISQDKRLRIINNAIDIDNFIFDPNIRSRIRDNIDIDEDTFVYGNVGKLSDQKNQSFLINVFSEIHRIKPKSELWIIGEGSERANLEKQASELKLDKAVRFWGQRSDVNELLQAMDCFVFTSKSEGLGIVAIEAQASGLPTIISDGVPVSASITDLCKQLTLRLSSERWARAVIEFCEKNQKRENMKQKIIDSGYEIKTEARKMTDFFLRYKK